jgi:hypothetical protein
MKCSVSHGPARTRAFLSARLHVLAAIAGLSLPLMAGCPGSLGGTGWPQPGGTGSGGAGTGTGGAGTGTGGSGTGTGGASAPCDAPAMVFPSCVNANCHKPMGPYPPDLSAAGVANLKTTNALFSSGPCANQPFITADKANSPILKRIQGTTCGPQMPMGLPALMPDQISCVTSWVNAQ